MPLLFHLLLHLVLFLLVPVQTGPEVPIKQHFTKLDMLCTPGELLLELVREFLEWAELDYTMSVFNTESRLVCVCLCLCVSVCVCVEGFGFGMCSWFLVFTSCQQLPIVSYCSADTHRTDMHTQRYTPAQTDPHMHTLLRSTQVRHELSASPLAALFVAKCAFSGA